MENYIVINGKRAKLTEEQLKQLGIVPEKKSCFERCESYEQYYYISYASIVESDIEQNTDVDELLYKNANYCTDKIIMKQRALHETLDRLLWRFSMENDGDKLDWSAYNPKYYIYFDYKKHEFKISYMNQYKTEMTVHFYSREIAERAIDEIIKPFIKEHPEFVW